LRAVLRDLASFIGGWTVIFQQAGIIFDPPSQTSELLILVAALAIGVPGVAQLVNMRGGGNSGASPSSPAVSEAPQQSSPGEPSRAGDSA
jgi:hypothetical protein